MDGTTQYSGSGNQDIGSHCRTTKITAVLSQYAHLRRDAERNATY